MQSNILQTATSHGQQHLVKHYHSIQDEKLKEKFLKQLEEVDYQQINQLFKNVYLQQLQNTDKKADVNFSPVQEVVNKEEILKNKEEFDKIGFKSISLGQVGVCIMSGGQGTRLGYDHAKGMYNIKLDSGQSIFQIFARRLLRLMEITKLQHPESIFSETNMIKWYIMTSLNNHEEIVHFFQENKYFGYDPDAIFFFPQGEIPVVGYDGKIVIESEGNLYLSAAGNGAIFQEMKNKGALAHMKKSGIKYLEIGPVDNVLLKLGDPTCTGYTISNKLDIVSLYVKKAYPDEKVGVHVLADGKVKICEYSELPKEITELRNQKGELVYLHGARATTFFTTSFIESLTHNQQLIDKMNKKYHLAEKKIRYFDEATRTSVKPEKNNCVKFELFYFDIFEDCEKFGLFETLREEEFAPVKNAEGNDSPESARLLMRNLHKKWLMEAGVEMEGEGYVEIDPRLSYEGEGVKKLVQEKYGGKVHLSVYIH